MHCKQVKWLRKVVYKHVVHCKQYMWEHKQCIVTMIGEYAKWCVCIFFMKISSEKQSCFSLMSQSLNDPNVQWVILMWVGLISYALNNGQATLFT